MSHTEETQEIAAAKAGMDVKTARKYLRARRLPSEMKAARHWRTRQDGFAEVWPEIAAQLSANAGLEAKTLFAALQRQYPERFVDGQLRTLQRRIKQWRASEGPPQEVYFVQEHRAGELCESDFTHLTELGITIAGQAFPHMLYHFVLTYSNWETGTICHSESFASLSEGLQNALWELGGVPLLHRTDRMTAAVNNLTERAEFQKSYQALLRHYNLEGRKIQTGQPNENGDVEQRHYRFRRALDQALMLRGSRDFAGVDEYRAYLVKLFQQLLGEQPVDRGDSGGAGVLRSSGGLVRRAEGGAAAAAAWTHQLSCRLPAHHRLAGTQARCLRELSLPRASVPEQQVPDHL